MLNKGASPTVRNCVFTGNAAQEGGGMANKQGSAPLVESCWFLGNGAYWDCDAVGGGMCNEDSSPTILGCWFVANTGDGMYNHDSTPTVRNSIFSRNTEDGIYNNGSIADVLNSLFYENQGVGVREVFNSDSELRSNIYWGNADGSIHKGPNSYSDVDFSNVQGGFPGNGNIDADPLFVAPEDDDFRLGPGSPCIDAAHGFAAPDLDIDGNPRVDDASAPNTGIGPPWADMGAFEHQP